MTNPQGELAVELPAGTYTLEVNAMGRTSSRTRFTVPGQLGPAASVWIQHPGFASASITLRPDSHEAIRIRLQTLRGPQR